MWFSGFLPPEQKDAELIYFNSMVQSLVKPLIETFSTFGNLIISSNIRPEVTLVLKFPNEILNYKRLWKGLEEELHNRLL